MRVILTLALVILFLPSLARGGELEKGQHAFHHGDCQAARELLQPLAGQGNPQAQVIIGSLYQNGCGEIQDYKQAYSWYKKAADQGNAEAKYNIGALYYSGWGLTKDRTAAMKWTRKAAAGGYTQAMIEIGKSYEAGCCGVKKDYVAARKWFDNAARHGDPKAIFDIGFMYLDGLGVKRNCDEAMKRFREAAERGYPNAQIQIGDMYNNGSCGVKQDYSEAYFWHTLPEAKQGSPWSAADDASHLTPSQIEVDEKRVLKWLKAHPAPDNAGDKPDAK